jgi:dihydrofolate reductase
MRKVIVSEFLSLDGVMEASEQWQPPYFSDDVAEEIRVGIHSSEALLLGRVTYEIFAAYWPLQTNNESGIADRLNSVHKFVVSTLRRKWKCHSKPRIPHATPQADQTTGRLPTPSPWRESQSRNSAPSSVVG